MPRGFSSHFRRQLRRSPTFPGTKDWAWWYLTRRQKRVLQEQRQLGHFGGIPGRAPYWHIQEVGEPKAHVRRQAYIRRSINALLQEQPMILAEFKGR